MLSSILWFQLLYNYPWWVGKGCVYKVCVCLRGVCVLPMVAGKRCLSVKGMCV